MSDTNQTAPTFRPDRYLYLHNFLTLDLLEIDQEVSMIATLIQDAGECAAIAITIRDAATNEFELAKASIAEGLRNQPIEGKKRSEAMIDSQLPLHPKYEEKIAALNVAKADAALWQVLVDALRTKSSALRTAADLIAAGYITSNSIMEKRRADIRKAGPA